MNPKYPMISLRELDGYIYDEASAFRFERRFSSLTWTGAAIAFGGFFIGLGLANYSIGEYYKLQFALLAVTLGVIGIAICLLSHFLMIRTKPINIKIKRPMDIYQLKESNDIKKIELVYVCHQSKTYFRRVYSEEGGT